MRKIREVLRLYFAAALSIRAIARSLRRLPRAADPGQPALGGQRRPSLRAGPESDLSRPRPPLRRGGLARAGPTPKGQSKGLAKALTEQLDAPEVDALSFEERLGLLVDRELTERHSRQLTNRLRRAKLRHDACIEDIDFRHRRGLDKELVLSFADGRWVREHLSILICGPAGVGKSWIACALAHRACRNGHSALYVRVSRLLSTLAIARADGRYPKLLESLAKTEVLVMDDWGLAPFTAENRHDLLEVLEAPRRPLDGRDQPSFPSTSGTTSSAIRPLPTRFSTVSCTMPTSSN